MPLYFSFATAGQIIFGNHSLEKVPELVRNSGKHVLIVSGNKTDRAREISAKISDFAASSIFKIVNEPTTEDIEKGVEFAKQIQCDVVIGIGGGSVIDGAKAIAALVPNQGELFEYLEVIGSGKPLENPPLTFIAVPTTAGTGAEATRNSVIKSIRHNVKVSLRSNLMYPDVAVIDPVLSHSMPPGLTASTGVDALTHLLETYVSKQSNSFIDNLCEDGLKRISRSLVNAFNNGGDAKAREDMAMASLLGGMALANVKLGAIHGFAGPMGGMFPIAHGRICACLMSAVIETNVEALQQQNMDITKFDKLAKLLTGSDMAKADDAVVWTNNLVKELKIPSLMHFGLKEENFPELVQKAKNASSMQGNPVNLSDEQLYYILEKSM